MFLSIIKKNVKIVHLKIIIFTAVKNYSILHRLVSVMFQAISQELCLRVLRASAVTELLAMFMIIIGYWQRFYYSVTYNGDIFQWTL